MTRTRPPIDPGKRRAAGRFSQGIAVWIVGTVVAFVALAAFVGAGVSGQPVAGHVGFVVAGIVFGVLAGWIFHRAWHRFHDPFRDWSNWEGQR